MHKTKQLLQNFLFLTGIILCNFSAHAQAISPRFFSQNAWMPDTIGNSSSCATPPCILYGQLHNKWSKIGESGSKTVRFGGIQADRNMPTQYQYIKMIDSIRAKGMEPIIQVPFYNWRYSASQAAQLVQYINVTRAKNIKYWIIGNEPDHVYGYTNSSQVAAYIKPFASAMKAVDSTIKIIGPETAWFNTNITNGLTNPGGPDDITGTDANGNYYIDIISFHCYAFDGTQTRAAMISKLMSSGGLDANLAYLNGRINTCNTSHNRTGNNALTTAITEANINWQNATTDNLNGTGVNSFIGGQFIAEMFGVGLKNKVDIINMWSVVEGNNTALNIGYIDGPTGNKKPAYYHFQMMSQHFNGNFISSVSTQTNVKVFSSQNSSLTTVFILNEDLTNNFNTTVRLNTAAISQTNALQISVNAGIAAEYTANITNQTSVLFQFDNSGTLVKKITYSLAGHAVSNLPPTVINIIPPIAVPVNMTPQTNLTRCTGKTATLTAASGTNNITWYSSATSTVALGTSSVFITPTLNVGASAQTFIYYAEASTSSTVSLRTPVSVTIHPRPVITVSSGSICAGDVFTMTPTGAGSYTVSGGSWIVSPSVTSNYYVTGTNSLGCTSTISAIASITVNTRPSIAVNSGSICAGASFVMVPTGASSYSITGNSATVTPTSSSSYSVTGMSAEGCPSTNTAVTMVNVIAIPLISVNSGSICAGETFTINPAGAASYIISGGSTTVSPQSTSSYTITGSNSSCISLPVVATVTVNTLPVVSVNSGTICTGSSFVMIPGGASSYSFSSGSATVSPTSSSAYSITGFSAEGCESAAAAIASVNVISIPVVAVNDGTICAGKVFTIVPGGATSYTFSGGSSTVSPASTTSYTITGSNGFCNSTPAISNVVVNARPVIGINSGSICAGQSFTLIPTGANSYTVNGGSFVVAPASNTAYYVTGTNSLGCTASVTSVANITVIQLPVISVNSGTICSGKVFTFTPSGASSYTFSSGSSTVAPSGTSSFTITGSNGSCLSANPAVANVFVNPTPVISVNSGSICAGKIFTLSPSGANSYTVNGGSFVVSPLTSTAYYVTGTNSLGCTASVTAVSNVSVIANPVVSVNSGSICKGASFTMTPTGANSYVYSSGVNIVLPLVSTSYTVTGTTNGCSAQAVSKVTLIVVKKSRSCPTDLLLVNVSAPESSSQKTIAVTNNDSYSFAFESAATSVDKNPAGISEKNNLFPVYSVYPNPNNGEFSIEVSEEVDFVVVNSLGDIVHQGTISTGKAQINISDLSAGMYFVKLSKGDKTQFTRIIKQ